MANGRTPNDTQAATLNALLSTMLALPSERRADWVESLAPEFASIKSRLHAMLKRASVPERANSLHTLPKVNAIGATTAADNGGRIAGARVGQYSLQRRLGIGGMGVVWLADDESVTPARRVALKFAHNRPDRSLRERLQREESLLAALEHPNIARLYASGMSDDGQLYLVLEYVQGMPLDRYCASCAASLAQRFALFVQIADALTHAHERLIVHRDLKPSNVLVTDEGEARLLDFGVAKLLDAENRGVSALELSALTGRPLTPEYASPEQLLGADIGFASDIYSLGVMLYEVVTGARPYMYKRGSNRALRDAILRAPPPPPSQVLERDDRRLRAHLTPEIDQLILTALEKQPGRRYGSMREFAAAIEDQARTLSRRVFGEV
jgi:serine/threonine protein kinase